jgi:hypothetical protein
VPNAEWDGRLASASKKFRELKDKAVTSVSGATTTAGGGVPEPGALR